MKSMKIFLLLFVLLLIVFNQAAMAQAGYVTKKGFLVATSKDLLKQGLNLYVSGDWEAFNIFLKYNPNVFIIKEGLPVYVMSVGLFYIEIRPEGSPYTLWTSREAVQIK